MKVKGGKRKGNHLHAGGNSCCCRQGRFEVFGGLIVPPSVWRRTLGVFNLFWKTPLSLVSSNPGGLELRACSSLGSILIITESDQMCL